MDNSTIFIICVILLTVLNVFGFKYLGFFGLFVSGASIPVFKELLKLVIK